MCEHVLDTLQKEYCVGISLFTNVTAMARSYTYHLGDDF